MKTYTQDDIDRMEEIRDEMRDLTAEIKRITDGDGHTEAYFTNHLDSLINGGYNRYDMDFDKIIDNMRESLESGKPCDECGDSDCWNYDCRESMEAAI